MTRSDSTQVRLAILAARDKLRRARELRSTTRLRKTRAARRRSAAAVPF